MRLVNIGCGATFHADWINLDLQPASDQVTAHDIRTGLPFPADSVDACYSSHVLEHLTPQQARLFLDECYRVLKPGGIARIVVPDLERIAKEYLRTLQAAVDSDPLGAENHEWMTLELLDQMVRTAPGGQMGRYLRQAEIRNRHYVHDRIGAEAEAIWRQSQALPRSLFRRRMTRRLLTSAWQRTRMAAVRIFVSVVAGPRVRCAFDEGLFRNQGEVHYWMYDRYSLTRLLETRGFVEARCCSASESWIPQFAEYRLDSLDGRPLKPDSLYVEALKPPAANTRRRVQA